MKRITFAAAAASLAIATAANASLIPYMNVPVTHSSGGYVFNYTAVLSGDEGLVANDYLVIYDFSGFTGTFTAPADWVLTTPLVSPGDPIFPGQVDNPNIENLVFTYEGPPMQRFMTLGSGADLDFTFTADSIYGGVRIGDYGAVAEINQGSLRGTGTSNTGFVQTPAAIPEPGAWALMLFGAGLAGVTLRRRAFTRPA